MPQLGRRINSDNNGTTIDIAIWVCFVVSGVAVFSKVLTKLTRHKSRIRIRNLGLDDWLLTLAILFCASNTIVVSQYVSYGLGLRSDTVNTVLFDRAEKALYASHILYLGAISSANAAACGFALSLQPSPAFTRILRIGLVLIVVWSITSMFALAFQCQIPFAWRVITGKCINQPALWTFIEAFNVFTAILIGGILCAIVWILQMSHTKYILILVFTARALVLPPIIMRLIYIYEIHRGPSVGGDTASLYANFAIATTVSMNTCILITCIPYLKPLMEHLQPGWSTTDVRRGIGYNAMLGQADTFIRFPTGSVVRPKGSEIRSTDSPTRPVFAQANALDGLQNPGATASSLQFITRAAIPDTF